jgi:hypothetical protein
MAAKFIWDLDMTNKIRTSLIKKFTIRRSFDEQTFWVDAQCGKFTYCIKTTSSEEAAKVFIEELSAAI